MQWFKDHFVNKKDKILDVGSMDINGSYKNMFKGFDYTGLDITTGGNVNIVPDDKYNWKELATDSFDIVISGQAFEHIEYFWLTIAEMTRVLKEGGLMCIIAPRGFREHRHPVDCWRFLEDGMIALARYTSLVIVYARTDFPPRLWQINKWIKGGREDSILIAQKPYSGETKIKKK